MLLKDFYEIVTLDQDGSGKYHSLIDINPRHAIFEGHFPKNPVMPGVCMMQIIKELTEKITGAKLVIKTLSNIKFMALINPDATKRLRLEIDLSDDGGLIKIKNTTYFNDTIALKLNCTCSKITL